MTNIRNFSIIAHIDHGKSTLADRFLELTGTIEKRAMREQVLDSMELERERGITIKMQPVRMKYKNFILNLIDTPGHIDFSYEVSRALSAVEGSILLVDATQGIEAQTFTTLTMAKAAGLVIIPVISKIDSSLARVDKTSEEIEKVLNIDKKEILRVSGKTGEGVEKLLEEIIKRIPPPGPGSNVLIFDFKYSNHKGVIVFVRIFGGEVRKGDKLGFKVAGKEFTALEVGIFAPEERAAECLRVGEIGYIVTGIKEPGVASVGDTLSKPGFDTAAPPGYEKPHPVVWASVYPENQHDFPALKRALSRLWLSDSAFSFEEESSGALGRGFRCGFLGMLHLEIITERLRREFDLPLVVTLPSVTYDVILKTGKTDRIYSAALFPEDHLIKEVWEPWIEASVITPPDYLSSLIQLLFEHEAEIGETTSFGERLELHFQMPLRELMRGFCAMLKAVTSGFGSISYKINGERLAEVTRLDMVVADEPVMALARVISKKQVETEAEKAVDRLIQFLPRQMFTVKIQAKALGRIIASRALSGMKKDVTQHMYGGDITRKMKLREKQKKGKKKMREKGRVNIPQDIFVKMMRRG